MSKREDRVSRTWLQQVDKALIDRGWTRRKLASAIQLDESNISRLFAMKAGKTTIRKVALALGLPDPLTSENVDDWDHWLSIGARMRDAEPERFRLILGALRSWDDAQGKWEQVAKLTTR